MQLVEDVLEHVSRPFAGNVENLRVCDVGLVVGTCGEDRAMSRASLVVVDLKRRQIGGGVTGERDDVLFRKGSPRTVEFEEFQRDLLGTGESRTMYRAGGSRSPG
jgi:hypothetical protein